MESGGPAHESPGQQGARHHRGLAQRLPSYSSGLERSTIAQLQIGELVLDIMPCCWDDTWSAYQHTLKIAWKGAMVLNPEILRSGPDKLIYGTADSLVQTLEHAMESVESHIRVSVRLSCQRVEAYGSPHCYVVCNNNVHVPTYCNTHNHRRQISSADRQK